MYDTRNLARHGCIIFQFLRKAGGLRPPPVRFRLRFPEISRNQPKVAKSSQKQPKVAKSSQKQPKVAKSRQKQTKVDKCSQKQPNDAKGSKTQPKLAKIEEKKEEQLAIRFFFGLWNDFNLFPARHPRTGQGGLGSSFITR